MRRLSPISPHNTAANPISLTTHSPATGGSTGLGRSFAIKCAKAGAKVAIVARRQAPLDEALQAIKAVAKRPDDCIAISADVADEAAVKSAVAKAVAALG